ncbi:MAG: LysM domain-containing protein [Eubacteriales bacterium]
MNFPKNIMQIGTVGEYLKVYIEDYVYTFMKQVEQENKEATTRYILYGKEERRDSCHYLFVYGAVEEKEKNKIVQKDYFQMYQVIGRLETKIQQKKIYFKNGTSNMIEGFFIFYEQNPEMQSYLVHMNKKIEVMERTYHARGMKKELPNKQEDAHNANEIVDKGISRKKLETIKSENRKAVKSMKRKPRFKVVSIWSCLMTIMLGIVGVGTMNGYTTMSQFVDDIGQVLELEQTMNEIDTPIIVVEKTTEEKLAEEMELGEVDEVVVENSDEEIGFSESITESEDDIKIEISKEDSEAVISSEVVVMDKQEEATADEKLEHEVYIIQEGDTLAAVCEAKYQSTDKISEVCSLNNIENPDKIIQGQAIILPIE